MTGTIAPGTSPDDPAHTEVSDSAYEVEHAAAAGNAGAPPGCSETNEPIPVPNECPDVGMAPGRTGEGALIRRETNL